jgi:peptide/nickel transport system substrate-binding protein
MRVRVIPALVIAMLLAVLAGCGSDGGGSDTGTTVADPTTSTTSGDPAEEQIAAPYSELNWGFPSGVRQLDYTKDLNIPTLAIMRLGVETLMEMDQEGKLRPALAESSERRNPTTYVYNLRKDVKFWNGAPMTSDDVVYSLKRNQAKDSATSIFFTNVKDVTAEGKYTVVVTLKQPDTTWEYVPAYSGQIVEKKFGEAAGDKLGTPGTLTMGTGPWKIESFNPDSGVELVRNDDWWGGEAPAERVSIKFLTDEASTSLALRSGEIDGVFDADPSAVSDIPDVDLLEAPGTAIGWISMNTQAAPFDDVHVRRAIAYATNREGMVEAAFRGKATPMKTLVPPTLYPNVAPLDEVEGAYADLPDYPYDLEAAKKELAMSKYPDGFSTTVLGGNSYPTWIKTAEILSADLAKIGIDMKVEEVPMSQWLEVFYGPREKLGIMIGQVETGPPDPTFYPSILLDSSGAVANGLNEAVYKNPEVDKLIASAKATGNNDVRFDDMMKMLQITGEDVPYVPTWSPQKLAAVSSSFEYEEFSPWYYLGTWALNIGEA